MTEPLAPVGRPTEPTDELQRPAHLWKPGQSGNPNGRAKGNRNKLGEKFVEDLYADWKDHGIEAIVQVRAEKPDAYLKVIASILPKDVNVNINQFDQMTEDELIARIRALDAIVRPFLDGPTGSPANEGRSNGSAQAQTVN